MSVSVKSKDYQVVTSVKDNGQGVDPDILPRLFTEFASKSEIGGTGLGLFISKSIVEAYSGGILAQNTMDGKGAAFSFSLSTINNHHDYHCHYHHLTYIYR